ncbi:MAG: DUF1902 domain-containing protein [Geminicoccaceae bacterium]
MATSDRMLNVRALWDEAGRVWVAMSDDVPGLVLEAASLDELFLELQEWIPEMLELDGKGDGRHAPFRLVAAHGEPGVTAARGR